MNTIYTLITRALSQELVCQYHNIPLTLINKDIGLVCEQCDEEDTHPLQQFFENPISLILWYNNNKQYSKQWLRKSVHQNIQYKLQNSKSVLKTYLNQLQKTISTYCKNIFQQYSSLVDKMIDSSSKPLYDLQKINQLYCSQLQDQINDNDLSLKFLNDLIYRFITSNQNPSNKISSEIKSAMSVLEKLTYLNLDQLVKHYQNMCDPFKWKLSNFVLNHPNDNQIFDYLVDSIHLADKNHYLKYGEEGIAIYSYQSKLPICSHLIPIDDCYQINGYKVYGYNQNQIVIFSYLNPSQFEIIKRTKVRFPSNFSYENPYIYYKSDNIQWKWNTIDQPEPLSKTTSSQFIKAKDSLYKISDHKQPVQLNIENNFVTLS